MKKSGNRIASVAMAVVMAFGSMGTAFGYTAKGNEAVSSGEASVVDGVVENLKEYSVKLLGLAEDEITSEVSGIELPEWAGAIQTTYELLAESAYAFVDLGSAIFEFGEAQADYIRGIQDRYRDVSHALANTVENAYRLGADHRGTDKPIPYETFKSGNQSAQIYRDIADGIRRERNNTILIGRTGVKKDIEKMADSLDDLIDHVGDGSKFYYLGRYGVPYIPELPEEGADAVTDMGIQTGVKYNLTDSNGKNLNLYTNKSAGSMGNGVKVSVYAPTTSDTQQFIFEDSDQGYRIYIGKKGGKVLDVYNKTDKTARAGARLQCWKKNGASCDQQFVVEQVGDRIALLLEADQELAVTVDDDGFVRLRKYREADNQLWKLKAVE
ncbi:MAG: RICIN domain-containing protein [Eubacteriales bacterium]|nr:RICIN domain-containing protein [Eubacteriales bacterium]